MNENFLSRGKCKDDGEWVKGNLLYDEISGVAAIVTYVNLSGVVCDLSEINIYEVIPKTVGRYTGLNDKNGTLIFEGDRIRFIALNGSKRTGTVFWSAVSWFIDGRTERGTELIYKLDYVVLGSIEVIGNIYDDTEINGGD